MLVTNKLWLLIPVLILISGCEYELGKENFVDLEPPPETHLFNLNLMPAGDTIKIFNTSSFSYNFNTYGLDIIEAGFSLGEKKWTFHSDGNGVITINPEEFPAGQDTLIMYVYTHSGTGSIADIAGAEGYMAERMWPA